MLDAGTPTFSLIEYADIPTLKTFVIHMISLKGTEIHLALSPVFDGVASLSVFCSPLALNCPACIMLLRVAMASVNSKDSQLDFAWCCGWKIRMMPRGPVGPDYHILLQTLQRLLYCLQNFEKIEGMLSWIGQQYWPYKVSTLQQWTHLCFTDSSGTHATSQGEDYSMCSFRAAKYLFLMIILANRHWSLLSQLLVKSPVCQD